MICDNCGCDIPENQNTCPNCGCDCDKKAVSSDTCQRGTDEGLPDMDLGKTTRYYTKKRKTPVEKTRWEKFLLKYRPLQDAAPEEFESAAKRNEIISIFLNIFSVLCFLSGLTSALGIFFSVLSIMFADYAVEYYKKDVVNQNKNYYLLKGTCRLLFWMNVIMLATAAFYWAYAYVRNKASFFGMSIIKWIYLGIKQALN